MNVIANPKFSDCTFHVTDKASGRVVGKIKSFWLEEVNIGEDPFYKMGCTFFLTEDGKPLIEGMHRERQRP